MKMAALQITMANRSEVPRGTFRWAVLFTIALTLITLLATGTSMACPGAHKPSQEKSLNFGQPGSVHTVAVLSASAPLIEHDAPCDNHSSSCPCGCGMCSSYTS